MRRRLVDQSGPAIVMLGALLAVVAVPRSSSQVPEAAAAPLRSTMERDEAWLGERVVVVVELLSPTAFSGSPSFEIPRVSGAVALRASGSPVISAETIDGREHFIQRHEVHVYAQREGEIVVPPIAVRFGITGAEGTELQGSTPEYRFQAKRPPGAEGIGLLVTTSSLKVSESWDARPEELKVGDGFVRTVTLEASGVPGIVLPALPTEVEAGLRVYPREPLIEDRSERGALSGKRVERHSYLAETPGTYTLPELRFPWWDPGAETLHWETLEAVSFTVVPGPVSPGARNSATGEAGSDSGRAWIAVLLVGLALLGVAIGLSRRRLAMHWNQWREGEAHAFRRLIRACRSGQAGEALTAWETWWRRLGGDQRELWSAMLEEEEIAAQRSSLQATAFGDAAGSSWDGRLMARQLIACRDRLKRGGREVVEVSSLPAINPGRNLRSDAGS